MYRPIMSDAIAGTRNVFDGPDTSLIINGAFSERRRRRLLRDDGRYNFFLRDII